MFFRETYKLHDQFIRDNKFNIDFFVSKTIEINKDDFYSFTITSSKNLNKYIQLSASKDYIFIDFFTIEGNLKESKKYNNNYEEIKEIIFYSFHNC